ncbi:MAG: MobF family relaxase [Streptosporangiaceae bacterium]
MVISVKAGHDAGYYTRGVGGGREAATGGDYYLSAAAKLGEPEGTWIGEGLADLGIHDGDTVAEADFLALYDGFVNPRTGEHLGSAPRVDAELRKLFAAKKAAETGPLTRERERELWNEARAEVKSAGVMYYDTTFAVDKSVSLAHASALASAEKARQAGDLRECEMWEARAAGIWAEIDKAVRVWVGYAQAESRFVRTGHHGKRQEGVELGRFEDSEEIPVAVFPHHTSRDGDPSLHVHVLFLNKVQTVSDRKWRALDGRALYRVRGAGAAISALSLETALSQAQGFGWVYRPKSHGRVIEGVSDKTIVAFSSRRTAIDKLSLELAEQYRAEYGTEPTQRAVWSMTRHAHRLTRKGKSEKLIDHAELLADWERTSRANELGSLTELAQELWTGSAAQAQERLRLAGELTMSQERELMMIALAQAQAGSAAWSRQTLLHRLGENMPDYVTAAGPEHAQAVLEGLADRVLGGEGGDRVHCLTAGEFPRVPGYLRRASGESMFRAHGIELFATESQLTLEARIIAQAGAEKAPHLEPELAAELLGADMDDLESQLHDAAMAQDFETGSGLSASQAAVAFNALTSERRAEVVVAVAGSGKSYTAGKVAEAWAQSGGRVIGVALSSNARDVLAATSPRIEAWNTAQLLGDLPGEPGALGPKDIGDDALIVVDEASLIGLTDWARLLDLAEERHAKLLILGDTHQLDSPEAGGGLQMLARKLGYAQLSEVHRFDATWQKVASVQLRAGDRQALVAYDDHGYLHGGSYVAMAEAAARAYLADYLAGKDTLLLAQSNAEARDLARRVQGFLIEWGHLGTESAALREGQRAYSGDVLIARQNGHGLINSDRLRLVSVTDDSATVSRRGQSDDGGYTWSEPMTIPLDYLARHVDVGYAQTWTTSQGRTVAGTAHSLVSSSTGRNGLYESMTRAKDENHGWIYEAGDDCDHVPGAPEVDRERQREAERQGDVIERAGTADAVRLAAQILARLDEPMSATEVRERSLSNADSLQALGVIWADQIRADGAQRYAIELARVLGEAGTTEVLRDTDDLYRALRHAELAGLDSATVLADAVSSRSLAGADNVSAVLAHRVRKATEGVPATLRDSWLDWVPATGDDEYRGFMTRLARAMDARQVREAAFVADTAPVWAVQTLGPVPEFGTAERDQWEHAAGKLVSARAMTGWDHDGLALGAQPSTTHPEARAEWANGLSVMARVDGVDVRGLSDGLLFARRRAYEAETAWAPASVAEELRVIRLTELDARMEAARCAHDAAAAKRTGRDAWARLHESRAADREAVREKCGRLAADLEPAQATREDWELLTADTQRVALAADLELKRRGALQPDDRMNVREPDGLVPGELDDDNRETTIRQALGIDTGSAEVTARVAELAEASRATQARIDEIRSMTIPDPDSDDIAPGAAWSALIGQERSSILQPPELLVPQSPHVSVPDLGYDDAERE